MSHEPVRHRDTLITPMSLDPDAVNIVRRLNEAGLESYFVGGCVRDLLLGMLPKDFDISTAARPRQIRRLFRNSRIIGRRFKLAHIHFHGGKIIEVATFRSMPVGVGDAPRGDNQPADETELPLDEQDGPGEFPADEARDAAPDRDVDLLITRDNEFGTAEEDVLRRDFTINALLYDVRTGEVIDYVGGVEDVRQRVLRTIGDPFVRFAEDPVRMLRAVKFMSRLQMTAAPEVQAALSSSADLIQRSAPPRVLEEIYKLLCCGRASRALPLLLEFRLLEQLLPDLAPYWSQHAEELAATGAALDAVDHGRRRLSNAELLAVLHRQPWRARIAETPDQDPLIALNDLLDRTALRMNIPRRDQAIVRQLLLTELRLEQPRRGRRLRLGDFLRRPATREAVQLLYLFSLAGCADPEVHADWAQQLAEADFDGAPHPHDPQREGAQRQSPEGAPFGPGDAGRRRRRRGGRRRRGRRGLPHHEDLPQGPMPQGGPAGANSSDDGELPRRGWSRDEAGAPQDGRDSAAGQPAAAAAGTDGEPAAPGGGERQGRRRRRGGRRRRGRRGGQPDVARGPAGQQPREQRSHGPRPEAPPTEGPRENANRSAGRANRPDRPDRRPGAPPPSRERREADKPPAPGRGHPERHPEDIEDIFDW